MWWQDYGLSHKQNKVFLFATQNGLLEVQLLQWWSYQEHKCYPAAFKAAARAFLMCVMKGAAPCDGEGRQPKKQLRVLRRKLIEADAVYHITTQLCN